MLQSSPDRPSREWTEGAAINQYGRLETDELEAGAKARIAARGRAASRIPL